MNREASSLFEEGTEARGVNLLFGRCNACGGLTFPACAYGCQNCGAADQQLEKVSQPGVGVLLRWVVVAPNIIPGVGREMLVGEVQLTDNIVEEAFLDAAVSELQSGMRVEAVAKRNESNEVECWFTPVGGAQ